MLRGIARRCSFGSWIYALNQGLFGIGLSTLHWLFVLANPPTNLVLQFRGLVIMMRPHAATYPPSVKNASSLVFPQHH